MPPAYNNPDRYLSPKELAFELEACGVYGLGAKQCRSLVRSMREEGSPHIIRRTYCRAGTAHQWLLEHPDWLPFRRSKK